MKLISWVPSVAFIVDVGKEVLKVFLPVQALWFAWTEFNVVNPLAFKFVNFISWLAVVADI